jgi:endoglucanase
MAAARRDCVGGQHAAVQRAGRLTSHSVSHNRSGACESLAGLILAGLIRVGKTWFAAGVLAAVACLGSAGVCSAAGPRLKLVGNHLVDARSGLDFVPRGVNWPSFEYACHDGYGYSNSATAKSVGPDAAGAAAIASWHINTVRVPLNQDCWLGEDGLPAFGKVSGYRAAVRRWVSTLHRAGLAVILDLHWSGPAGVVADGLRTMPDDRSDDFWRSVARTFRGDRSMIFDAFNEPYARFSAAGLPLFDLTWDCWRNGGCKAPRAHLLQPLDGTSYTASGMQAMVDAIRATGARQPIMLAGRQFGNDLDGWAANRPADARLIASFHNYDFQPCHTTACWAATIAPLAAQVPVVTGEFGEVDCGASHLRSFMKWADRRGVGYLMWAWWVLPDRRCSALAVLANVRGRARSPNGTVFRSHLAALAPRLSVGGPRTQPLDGAVEVRVRCKKRCHARAEGRLLVAPGSPAQAVASRTFRLEPAAHALRPGRSRTLALKVPRKARREASAALPLGGSVSARITIVVTDGSESSLKRHSVKLGSSP